MNDSQFSITRVLDAPRELVWKAWTQAEHLAQWWGPTGCSLTVEKLELQPGGVFHYRMSTPGGAMWGRFDYREIEPPERMVYSSGFADEAGNIIRAPFSATFPLQILNTLTLTETSGKTTLTLYGAPLDATDEEHEFFKSMHASMEQGFGGTLDQLDAHLTKMGG